MRSFESCVIERKVVGCAIVDTVIDVTASVLTSVAGGAGREAVAARDRDNPRASLALMRVGSAIEVI